MDKGKIKLNATGPMITHKHHIVYKSLGGTDDPSNLVELDFVFHAELHAKDFLEGGPEFDFRHEGWKYLDEDLRLRVQQEKSRRQRGNGGNFGEGPPTWLGRTGTRWWNNGEVAIRVEETPGPGWVEGQLPSTNEKKGRPGVPKSSEWRENMKQMRVGELNPCAGRRWVTNGETNLYLKPGEETPKDYKPGRTL